VWSEGGCACSFGRCIRLDQANGQADFYVSHDWNLDRAGLPWFYFTTLENLRPEFHEQFLRESEQLWGLMDGGSAEKDAAEDLPRGS
jgi:hypothetical protein